MNDPLILARSLHLAATVLACGIAGYLVLVAEPALAAARPAGYALLRRRLVWMAWLALAAAILSGLVWLALLASDILGASIADVCLHGGAWQVASETRFGLVWMGRLALAVLLAALLPWPAMRLLQFVAAMGLLALLAFVGHAGATPGPSGDAHLASDMLHLVASGLWLGGLPALGWMLIEARKAGDADWRSYAAAATGRFSRVGIVCVAVLLASGMVNTWNLIGSPRDLIDTDYGRLILLKVALFVAMVGIAAVNRYRLAPRLAALTAMRALARNSLAETGLGVCALAFAGALGTLTPTNHVHTPSGPIPPEAAFVHIHSTEAMADVMIDPGHPGPVTVSIHVLSEDLSNFPAKGVRLALDPPSPGAPSLERAAVPMPDGSWQVAGLPIPQRGIWTVRVIVSPNFGAPILLDGPIVIKP